MNSILQCDDSASLDKSLPDAVVVTVVQQTVRKGKALVDCTLDLVQETYFVHRGNG